MIRKSTIIVLFVSYLGVGNAFGQFSVGPKIGSMFFKPAYEKKVPLSDADIKVKFDFGYSFGAVVMYKLSEEFTFHSEVLYAKRGKVLEGGIQDLFSHEATYKYIEAPVLFAYTFKKKYYTGFINFGGNISYWLSGKGGIKSFEHEEVGIDSYEYEIIFGEMPDGDDSGNIFVEEPNRMQVGLDLGVGAMFNTTSPNSKILVELKFQHGHSWLAQDYGLDVGLDEYSEDLRFSFNTFSLSVGYLFSFDIGQGKEGKSTDINVTKKRRRK